MFSCCAAEESAGQPVEPLPDVTMDERQSPVAEPKQVDEPEPKQVEEKAKDEPPQATPPPPAAEEGAQLPYEYEFEIAKDAGSSLGLKLDQWKTGLFITALMGGGLIEGYNATAEDPRKVQHGDFIVAVNGVSASDEMVKTLKTVAGVLKLKLCRPLSVLIKMSKSEGKPLGLNLSIQDDRSSKTLFVGGIQDGAVKDYNEGAPKDLQLQVNDCITRVNAVSDTASQMLEELKKAKDVELVLVRPSA